MSDNELTEILYKKALGYNVEEVTTEFDSDGMELKRKVVVKHVPPDIAALKAYLEIVKQRDCAVMTDKELKQEKKRLLKRLKEEYGD